MRLFTVAALAQDAYDYDLTDLTTSEMTPTEVPTEMPQDLAEILGTADEPDAVSVLEEILQAAGPPVSRSSADESDDDDAAEIQNDFVATEAPVEEAEEAEDVAPADIARNYFPQYDDPVESGVNSIANLKVTLAANGNFEFTWIYDATHTDYNFEYQILEGNYQNVTDWTQYSSGSVDMTTDGTTTTTTLAAPYLNAMFRWRITPFVGVDAGHAGSVDAQSATDDVYHMPGTVYEGGGGYAAQILLPTDFSAGNYVPTDTNDALGYAIAVLVQFPAGCPDISVNFDVDGNYVYTDATVPNNHRLFVFPETHFSNQFSGPIKAFHYYVEGAAYTGCDLSDPANSVTVSIANGYLVRTTEAAKIDIGGIWPGDSSYPPVLYNEQHKINLTDYVQPATHIGPSRAISAPRIYFSTDPCEVSINVQEGLSPGWGFLNYYTSALDITDLWVAPEAGSNTGTGFKLQALIWLTEVGITFIYDTSIAGCETVLSTGTVTFLELDMTNLSKAVNPY